MAITSKGIVYPSDYSEVADIPEVMENMAQSIDEILVNEDEKIDNKVDKVTGKGLSTNDFSNEDKEKLNNLHNYDDAEVKEDISDLADAVEELDINKADKTEIPDVSNFITKTVDDLVNYYKKSETYTQTEINNLIGAIQQFHYEIVQALPQTGATNILYLVPRQESETNNVYDEYVYANNNWEKIGSTQIDLSNYYTKAQVDALINNIDLSNYYTKTQVDTLLSGKQNEINSNNKLNSDLVDDTNQTNKFVTASEKTTWNNKQDTLVSGTNIKTINGTSVLGSGNLEVGGNEVYIGDEQDAPATTKLLIDEEDMQWQGSEVVNSLAGNETNKAPSVKAVNDRFTYSTTEQVVGTWLGKPLYRKVIETTTTSAIGTWGNITNGLLGNELINIYGYAVYGQEILKLPYKAEIWFKLNATTHEIQEAHSANSFNGLNMKVAIEYTKTTD